MIQWLFLAMQLRLLLDRISVQYYPEFVWSAKFALQKQHKKCIFKDLPTTAQVVQLSSHASAYLTFVTHAGVQIFSMVSTIVNWWVLVQKYGIFWFWCQQSGFLVSAETGVGVSIMTNIAYMCICEVFCSLSFLAPLHLPVTIVGPTLR